MEPCLKILKLEKILTIIVVRFHGTLFENFEIRKKIQI